MKTLCDRCEQWTLLPPDGGKGKRPHALCEHCAAPQRADDRYAICPHCASFYLLEYGECPLCPHAVISAAALDGSQAYATEAQQRKSRDGQYFWQLYLDYQLQPAEPPAEEAAGKPAANGNGHALGAPSVNGTSNGNSNGNGNGHAPVALSADSVSSNGNADDNPKSRIGVPPGPPKSTVDLAVTESMPMALFNDDETSVYTAGAAQVKVSAGAYNEFEYELIQDPSRLAEVAEMLTQEAVLGIDTETTGLDPHSVQLLLLQVSTADKVYIVDCKRLVPLALKSILENPKILKVAQNAKFEYEMLKQQTGITLSGIFDTMLAERVLTSGISREISLKAIAQKYIQATLDKTVRENFYKLTANGDAYLADEQLHYAARDAFIMIPIQQLQVPELTKHKLLQVADLEFRCIAAVGDMELAGVKIDEASWRKIIDQVTIERDKAAGELADMLEPTSMQATMFGIPSINLNSNVQLTEALSKLGVDLPDTMEATLVKFDHPAVKKLLEYRGLEKTLSAFGESVLSLINPHTGRIHPDFNQHGADTGRFSCTKPNIQQIPTTSDFRKCFVAPEGYKLVTCDYSQAELRILAELSGDEGFVNAFQSGGDLHALTASQMFGVPLEDVSKPQRSAAKAINFGLAYGMGPGGLAPRLGVSLDEAKELIARYFKAYPGVQKWLEKAAKDAVRLQYSVTTLGRKRFYTLPDESLKRFNEDEYRRQIGAIERQGKNSPIQGCVKGSTRIFERTSGYTRIEDLSGKAVEVWDGDKYVKAFVLPSGKKKLVKVTLRGGHFIECSPDHKFWVACNNGYKWVWKWKTPSEIRKENRVCLTNPVTEWHLPLDIEAAVHSDIHNVHRACVTQIADVSHQGEWLGRIASDGSVSDKTVTLMVAEHEESILERLSSITAQLGHVSQAVRITEAQPRRFHTLVVGSRGLGKQLLSAGVKDRIPAFVWRDSTLLSSYLRGLFDGDGTVHPDGAILTFGQGDKHLEWAREVQEALLLFGIRSRLSVYTNKHRRINLRIMKKDMPLFCERVGFINPDKQEKALQIRAERWQRISPQYGMAQLVESIEFTDESVEMFDVVNSETGRFMANGMVVHNSNADMTKLALIRLRSALKEWDARTVNTVHDEIVVEVRNDQAEEVKHVVEREMVRAGEMILKSVPIVAEASLADYWSK
jgi:DNA polymerase-1